MRPARLACQLQFARDRASSMLRYPGRLVGQHAPGVGLSTWVRRPAGGTAAPTHSFTLAASCERRDCQSGKDRTWKWARRWTASARRRSERQQVGEAVQAGQRCHLVQYTRCVEAVRAGMARVSAAACSGDWMSSARDAGLGDRRGGVTELGGAQVRHPGAAALLRDAASTRERGEPARAAANDRWRPKKSTHLIRSQEAVQFRARARRDGGNPPPRQLPPECAACWIRVLGMSLFSLATGARLVGAGHRAHASPSTAGSASVTRHQVDQLVGCSTVRESLLQSGKPVRTVEGAVGKR